MNFKNMSIKKNLIIGFGTTILVSLIIIVTSLVMMSSQKAAYQDIIDHYVKANQLVSECRIDYNIAARGLRDAVLSGEVSNLDTATSKMNQLESVITELNNNFPMDDKTILNTFINTMQEWGTEAAKIVQVARTDRESAVPMITESCSPKLAAAATAGDSLASQLQAGQEEIIKQQNTTSTIGIFAIIAVMVVATVVVMIMAVKIIRSIAEPSNQVRAALVGFSQGNLGIPVSFTGKNELGEMCDALRTSQRVLHSVIQDISSTTGQMAKGNFDVELTATFPGDLAPIQSSVNQFVAHMSDVITNISQSASQVSAGSEQVSNSSQSLAQGATEQASAVQELAATINDISTSSKQTAASAEEARTSVGQAGEQVSVSNDYVKQLNVAMSNISSSSEEIGKIIATIENIAFQTNILALNAAVEAARAGSAGKGFAVVADEVRNLASKSAEASQSTTALIERSAAAVGKGTQMANATAKQLEGIVSQAQGIVDTINAIASDARMQADAVEQVQSQVGQISGVVQSNSSSAEESAATSEELSAQSSVLRQLVQTFRLRQMR